MNKAKCLLCGDIIESKSVHDFQTCKCGSLSVDGGKDYLKRSFVNEKDYLELSFEDDYKEENIKLIKKYLKELLKLDYSKLDLVEAISLEHRLYYDIYKPFKEMSK